MLENQYIASLQHNHPKSLELQKRDQQKIKVNEQIITNKNIIKMHAMNGSLLPLIGYEGKINDNIFDRYNRVLLPSLKKTEHTNCQEEETSHKINKIMQSSKPKQISFRSPNLNLNLNLNLNPHPKIVQSSNIPIKQQSQPPIKSPPSIIKSKLPYINRDQIILKQNQINNIECFVQLHGFYKAKCSWVRVIRNEMQICCEQSQEGLVPVYGRVKIKFFNYLLTLTTHGYTLDKQLKQFGSLQQRIIIKYLKNIIKGLLVIHRKGNSLNVLTPQKILIDNYGNAYIDTVKCKNSNFISHEDKNNQFYYLSPQVLANNKNSIKNDVWSIGSLILTMIIGDKISDKTYIHPYCFFTPSLCHDKNKKNTSNITQKLNRIKNIRKIMLKDRDDRTKTSIQALSLNSAREPTNDRNTNNNLLNLSKKFSLDEKSSTAQNNSIIMNNNNNNANNNHGNKKQMIELEISEDLYNFMMDCLELQEQNRLTLQEIVGKYQYMFE